MKSLMFYIQSYEDEKTSLIFKKGRDIPQRSKNRIAPSDSAYQRTLLQISQASIFKNVKILYILPEVRFVCFFPRGNHIKPVVLEYWERAHLNGN